MPTGPAFALILAAFSDLPSIDAPVVTEPPTIDGRLDEPVWERAVKVDTFSAAKPTEGAPPSERTQVRLLRDSQALYLAFEAFERDPSQVRVSFGDRDDVGSDDLVGVLLDPFGDERRGFEFLMNPYGFQLDCVQIESGNEDCTWDALYDSRGRTTPEGFVVEARIPFASLRFDPTRDAWRMQLLRVIRRTGEALVWSPFQAARGGFLRQTGHLTGMRGIPARRTAELLPEMTMRAGPATSRAGALYAPEADSGLPENAAADLGLSAKVARAGGAVDLAINPDYSQIESDASRIAANERFALYYDEKRPFFLEGRELFAMPWEAVYTRSIVDPVYGAKVSGKAGRTAFAVLHAEDDQPAASVVDGRWSPESYAEGRAISTVARGVTDFGGDNTAGFLATTKRVGEHWNRVVGADGKVAVTESYRLIAQGLWSATDLPGGLYETGTAVKVRLRGGDRRLSWFQWYEQIDPDFRAETGYIPRVGYREAGLGPSYRIETGRSTGLLAVRPEVEVSWLDSQVDHDFERFGRTRIVFEFPATRFVVAGAAAEEGFSNRTFHKNRVAVGGGGSPTGWLSFDADLSAGKQISYFQPDDPYVGGVVAAGGGVELKPWDRLRFGARYGRSIFSSGEVGDAWRQLTSRGGEETVFDEAVSRGSVLFFLTPSISARVIGDWTSDSDRIVLSGLLSYRPGPGTVFYVGYQDAAPAGADPSTAPARAAFLKLSYLWRS